MSQESSPFVPQEATEYCPMTTTVDNNHHGSFLLSLLQERLFSPFLMTTQSSSSPSMVGTSSCATATSSSLTSSMSSLLWSSTSLSSSSSSFSSSSSSSFLWFSSSSHWFRSALFCLTLAYLGSELLFYLYFHWYLVPHANQKNQADIYHDYPEPHQRVHLCRRIIQRLEQKAIRQCQRQRKERQQQEDKDNSSSGRSSSTTTEADDLARCHQQVIRDFLLQWFEYIPPPYVVEDATSSSNLCGDDKDDDTCTRGGASSCSPRPPPLAMDSTASSSSSLSARNSSSRRRRRRNISDRSNSSSSSSCCSLSDTSSLQSDDGGTSDGTSTTTAMNPRPLWSIPGLYAPAVRQFFAWAFFAKELQHLTPAERLGLEDCYKSLLELTGLVIVDEKDATQQKTTMMKEDVPPPLYEPRRLSLETVQALHRPWIVYAMVAGTQFVTRNVLLPWLGFRRVVTSSASTGHVSLVAWHRPSAAAGSSLSTDDCSLAHPQNEEQQQEEVCLFFHGIAPAGVACYLPMIQALLGKREQELILFENPSVSCQFHLFPSFDSLTEQETVQGIQDILQQLQLWTDRHSLTVVGHSFGSCPITWMLRRRHQFIPRLHHVVLLDPVTILLSEPTVMSRFLYERDEDKAHIRFLVASELFTEYYLRRHFCWYNSELWLEDFITVEPSGTSIQQKESRTNNKNNTKKNDPHQWTIVLGGRDEIVPSPVVQEHVQNLQDNHQWTNCNLVYWPHSKHANCVMSPHRWELLKQFLFQTGRRLQDRKKDD